MDVFKVIPNYEMYGHRQTKPTDCPGHKLYEEIQTWDHWVRMSPDSMIVLD